MTLLMQDIRGERGISMQAMKLELTPLEADLRLMERIAEQGQKNLQLAKALECKARLEVLLTLFEVTEDPAKMLMPLGRAAWERATAQRMLFSHSDWQREEDCQLPLAGLDFLLGRLAFYHQDAVISRRTMMGDLNHPNTYRYGEAGFILVTKDSVRQCVSDYWLAKPDPDRLPYLPKIAGNIPFIRSFAQTAHDMVWKWGVFFPENRPMPEETGGKARYEHGWDFDSEADAEAFALELVRLVETTPADEVLPLPESTVKLPAGLPLSHVYCCTNPVTSYVHT